MYSDFFLNLGGLFCKDKNVEKYPDFKQFSNFKKSEIAV